MLDRRLFIAEMAAIAGAAACVPATPDYAWIQQENARAKKAAELVKSVTMTARIGDFSFTYFTDRALTSYDQSFRLGQAHNFFGGKVFKQTEQGFEGPYADVVFVLGNPDLSTIVRLDQKTEVKDPIAPPTTYKAREVKFDRPKSAGGVLTVFKLEPDGSITQELYLDEFQLIHQRIHKSYGVQLGKPWRLVDNQSVEPVKGPLIETFPMHGRTGTIAYLYEMPLKALEIKPQTA